MMPSTGALLSRVSRAEIASEAATESTSAWGKPSLATFAISSSTMVLMVSASPGSTFVAINMMASSGPSMLMYALKLP